MPKSQKARKQARFNPLAAARRAAEGQEEPGTSAAAAEEAPKLSAHQLRHIERKRLQAETAALRSSKLKVSKADKVRQQAKTLRRAPKGGGGGGGGAGEAVEAVGEGAADDASMIDAPLEADEPLRGFR
ncbi:hypothetical protein EMIHUDRAFT_115152 [Emiliania huxleyi CCMP1516]|nr:hypothetical protein EMIHUDRAFT_115152 [Emiliania huxleyi CCMP1516]EOD26227.1 hypothetical protein EMIHUDRAFT_115152 [Emiliania huxleyi CCMP1516]|eukprot:XP_005778656.1 hypothetical protein EMIHUDRAFT_115152 [Emiliania huxleyi CCMP1516]